MNAPAPSLLENGVIIPFGQAVDVSTLTVLLPWSQFGFDLQRLRFVTVNLGVDLAQLIVETSEDGTHPDNDPNAGAGKTVMVQPGGQSTVDIGPDQAERAWWRLSAQTLDPFPTAQLKWQVSGAKKASR